MRFTRALITAPAGGGEPGAVRQLHAVVALSLWTSDRDSRTYACYGLIGAAARGLLLLDQSGSIVCGADPFGA